MGINKEYNQKLYEKKIKQLENYGLEDYLKYCLKKEEKKQEEKERKKKQEEEKKSKKKGKSQILRIKSVMKNKTKCEKT